jgi:hypothetical protein
MCEGHHRLKHHRRLRLMLLLHPLRLPRLQLLLRRQLRLLLPRLRRRLRRHLQRRPQKKPLLLRWLQFRLRLQHLQELQVD